MSTDTSIVDRLALLPTLEKLPRAQLEWLAAHGEVRQFETGRTVYSPDEPEGIYAVGTTSPGLIIVLEGHLAVYRVGHPGVGRQLRDLPPGTVSGLLPYSRLKKAQGRVVAVVPSAILLISADDIQAMTRECYEFTAFCVHEMIDRVRVFKSDDLQLEKMTSLGRLSAGIAHELNNPSSAIARSAREMDVCRRQIVASARALAAAGLTADQVSRCGTLEAAAERPTEDLSPLECADREEALETWLSSHGVDAVSADQLVETGITLDDLDAVAGDFSPGQLAAVLGCVVAAATASRLSAEIDGAARRIHGLVAAVKKHTHMDRAAEVEDVSLEPHLRDTLTLVKSRAGQKDITLDLAVEPEIPTVRGFVGELNQVWLNLVDNAIDAAPEHGTVRVTAAHERDAVVVRVIDDGAGIPEADLARIFDPFFTTKPIGEGAGLGLDVARTIVRGHHGSIEVDLRPGYTEFRVSLPTARASG